MRFITVLFLVLPLLSHAQMDRRAIAATLEADTSSSPGGGTPSSTFVEAEDHTFEGDMSNISPSSLGYANTSGDVTCAGCQTFASGGSMLYTLEHNISSLTIKAQKNNNFGSTPGNIEVLVNSISQTSIDFDPANSNSDWDQVESVVVAVDASTGDEIELACDIGIVTDWIEYVE